MNMAKTYEKPHAHNHTTGGTTSHVGNTGNAPSNGAMNGYGAGGKK